jgi:hypothetical protein
MTGQAGGDAVQPVAERRAAADDGGLLGEDQEGGLEGVLGILVVAQEPFANAQDERPVACDKCGKGRLIPAGAVQLQELVVGPVIGLGRGQGPKQMA